jgi:hypothetical protein
VRIRTFRVPLVSRAVGRVSTPRVPEHTATDHLTAITAQSASVSGIRLYVQVKRENIQHSGYPGARPASNLARNVELLLCSRI